MRHSPFQSLDPPLPLAVGLTHLKKVVFEDLTPSCTRFLRTLLLKPAKLQSFRFRVWQWEETVANDLNSLSILLPELFNHSIDYGQLHNQHYSLNIHDLGFSLSEDSSHTQTRGRFSFEIQKHSSCSHIFHKAASNLVHSIISALPSSLGIETQCMSFSKVQINRSRSTEDLKANWLVPFIASILLQKCSNVQYLVGLSETNWQIIHESFIQPSTDGSRLGDHLCLKGFAFKIVNGDTYCGDDEDSDSSPSEIDSVDGPIVLSGNSQWHYGVLDYGNADHAEEGVQEIVEESHSDPYSDSSDSGCSTDEELRQDQMAKICRTYLARNVKSAVLDKYNVRDLIKPYRQRKKELEFDTEPTLYDQIIEFCQVNPTVRLISSVPRCDMDVSWDTCDFVNPHSREYLEGWLRDINVVVEFVQIPLS